MFRVDDRRQLPEDELHAVPVQSLWQLDLAVMVVMNGDLMVFDMADPVSNRVKPAHEGIHLEEEFIPKGGFERRLVTEFMAGGAAEEAGAGAMGEERQ